MDVLFVILHQFADWESASLAAAINKNGKYTVKTVSVNKAPVVSIGGFSVIPDYTIDQAIRTEYAAVVLIGGYSWRSEEAKQVIPLVDHALEQKKLLGAICDATVFLGFIGKLNTIAHTCNSARILQEYAGNNYTGASLYKMEQSVRDSNVITANGTGYLEFARDILTALDVMPIADIQLWYNYYKNGMYTVLKEPDTLKRLLEARII